MLDQPTDDWVFLAGRPPLQEYLGFIAGQARDEHNLDVGTLMEAWNSANARVRELELSEAGVADNATIELLPRELEQIATEAMASPTIRSTFSNVPTTVGMVDLDTLVVFQKAINLRYAGEQGARLAGDTSIEAIFRLAVPVDDVGPAPGITRANQNTWIVTSPSTDLRFLGPAFLPSGLVPGFPPTGYPAGVLALGIGYGSNTLNAIAVGGRLILNNGSHRAYAMYGAGLRRVPCIIQTPRNVEELTVIASGDLATAQDRYLSIARPPMLRDYFDERLRTIVPVPRKHRQIRLTFGVEQIEVPAGGYQT
jgi:hypothetical protein